VAAKKTKDFKKRFCIVTRMARQAAGLTFTEMSQKLGVDPSTYINYEVRTPLPHNLALPFCAHANITLKNLFEKAERLRP